MSSISVIIVSWNTRDLLIDCLRSVYENTQIGELDVWVVDNGSKDGSAEAVAKKFPHAHLILNTENLGFAQANNQAIKECTSKFIVLLNSDTLVKPGALDRLVEFMDQHPKAGAVGPYLLNPDGTLQESCYPVPTLSRELWRLLHLDRVKPYGVYDMTKWDPETVRSVDAIKGACLLVRKTAIDQVGAFDPDYFMYTEEIDLCYRVKRAGWDLFWVPQSKVIHFGGQSTRLIAQQMFLSLYQTKVLFFRKNYGKISAVLYKCVLAFTATLRVLLSSLVLFKGKTVQEKSSSLSQRYISLLNSLPKM